MRTHTLLEPVSRGKWDSVKCYKFSSCSVYIWSEQLWEVLTAGQKAQLSWPATPGALKIPHRTENCISPCCLSCCLSLSHVFLFIYFFFRIRFQGFSFTRPELKTPTNSFLSLCGRVIHLAMAYCQQEGPWDICTLWATGQDILLWAPWNTFSSQGRLVSTI